MIIGVPLESYPCEQRVALVPDHIATLSKTGMEVHLQQGAGTKAGFSDSEYQNQGAQLVDSRERLLDSSDLLLQVRGYGANPEAGQVDLESFHAGQILVGFHNPLDSPSTAKELADKKLTVLALELLPRITRAQSMDALTSMATISGYKGALLAAGTLNKMYPLMMTAAGTVKPARVLVLGAGVAGLQAAATSNRLGAIVQAYDIRPAVKEQVESLGIKFLELDIETKETEGSEGYARSMNDEFYQRQQSLMAEAVSESDVVITTAAVPGKKSPILITKNMIQEMRPGSVIVDLAAEGGGNCELTDPGKTIETHGIHILGPLNIASSLPQHASQMYSHNITSFVQNLCKENQINLDLEDQIIEKTLLCHQGEVTNSRVLELLDFCSETAEK